MGAVDRLVTVRIQISKFHRSFTALPRATERKDRPQPARTNVRAMFLGWQRRRGWLTPTWRCLGRCCGPGAEIELGGFELLNRAAACQPSASGKRGTPMALAVSFIRRS